MVDANYRILMNSLGPILVAADTFGWHERGIGCDSNYGYVIDATTKIQAACRGYLARRIYE
eukprot:COSAG06_NODE_1685_length_8718_cov_7.598561_1_plen_61_part_00